MIAVDVTESLHFCVEADALAAEIWFRCERLLRHEAVSELANAGELKSAELFECQPL